MKFYNVSDTDMLNEWFTKKGEALAAFKKYKPEFDHLSITEYVLDGKLNGTMACRLLEGGGWADPAGTKTLKTWDKPYKAPGAEAA